MLSIKQVEIFPLEVVGACGICGDFMFALRSQLTDFLVNRSQMRRGREYS